MNTTDDNLEALHSGSFPESPSEQREHTVAQAVSTLGQVLNLIPRPENTTVLVAPIDTYQTVPLPPITEKIPQIIPIDKHRENVAVAITDAEARRAEIVEAERLATVTSLADARAKISQLPNQSHAAAQLVQERESA